MRFISLFIGIGLFIGAGFGFKQGDSFAWFVLLMAILNLMSFAIDEITDRIKKYIDEKEKK